MHHIKHKDVRKQSCFGLTEYSCCVMCIKPSGKPSKDKFVLWGTKVGKPLYCTQPHPVDIPEYQADQIPSPVCLPTTASKVLLLHPEWKETKEIKIRNRKNS